MKNVTQVEMEVKKDSKKDEDGNGTSKKDHKDAFANMLQSTRLDDKVEDLEQRLHGQAWLKTKEQLFAPDEKNGPTARYQAKFV